MLRIPIIFFFIFISLKGKCQEVKLFDGQIILPPGINLVFVGENHYVHQCNENNLHFVEELLKTGLKCHVFLEVEEAANYMLSDFFYNGDTSILYNIFDNNDFYAGFYNLPYIEYYKKMRSQLVSSSNRDKLTFSGIDLSSKVIGSLKYVNQILIKYNKNETSLKLSNTLDEAIKTKSYSNMDSLKYLIQTIKSEINFIHISENQEKQKIINICEDLEATHLCFTTKRVLYCREDYLYNKTIAAMKNNPSDIYLFLMGSDHIAKKILERRPLFNQLALRIVNQNKENFNVTSVLFACNKTVNEEGENEINIRYDCFDSTNSLIDKNSALKIRPVLPEHKDCYQTYDYYIYCDQCISWLKKVPYKK